MVRLQIMDAHGLIRRINAPQCRYYIRLTVYWLKIRNAVALSYLCTCILRDSLVLTTLKENIQLTNSILSKSSIPGCFGLSGSKLSNIRFVCTSPMPAILTQLKMFRLIALSRGETTFTNRFYVSSFYPRAVSGC